MFENPRRGRQARNFATNSPKILDLKSSSEQIFSRKLPLGAPEDLALTGTDGHLGFICTEGVGFGVYSIDGWGGGGYGEKKYFSRFLPNRQLT